MSDLISRSALIEKMNDYISHTDERNSEHYVCKRIKKIIEDALTVEAKPVVYGEWKSDLDSCGWINHTCSHCGYEKLTDIHVSLGWNFCPNCGADMRKKVEPMKVEIMKLTNRLLMLLECYGDGDLADGVCARVGSLDPFDEEEIEDTE